jgi:hypothetical protein
VQSSYHVDASLHGERWVNGHARPALVTITYGYRYVGKERKSVLISEI